MEEGLPPELADNMASLSEAVERIKKHVQSLLQSPMDTLLEQMDGIDYAKLNTLIAYSLTTLFYGTFSAILVSSLIVLQFILNRGAYLRQNIRLKRNLYALFI